MKLLSLAVVILTAFLAASCEKDLTDSTAGNPAAARKVLIAGKSGAFKDAVVRELLENLGENDYSATVTGFATLADRRIGNYGAVLLVSSLQAGQIVSRASEFISKNNSDKRIIVFYTRGSDNPPPGWAPPTFTVDAVSSASASVKVPEISARLSELIRKRF